jgi:hypothetical protein
VFRLAAILGPLVYGKAREGLNSARRKLVFLAAAGVLGLVAVIFALVLVTVLIAHEIGVIWALALMTALAAAATAGVLIALRAVDAKAARERSVLSRVPPGVYVSSLSRLLAGRRLGRGAALGALGLGAVLLLLFIGEGDDA